mgnify:FL=1
MNRIIYLNGEFCCETDAKISIFDRSFLFSDSVYEVTTVLDGKMIDFDNHMKRLDRSMSELKFSKMLDHELIKKFHKDLIAKNNLKEGIIYLHVSRGVADRSFNFPPKETNLTVAAFTQEKNLIENKESKNGISIMTLEDKRWKRCDIKTTQLLYPSFAKAEAYEKGFDDAWMLRDGYVSEGTSNNAWIIKSGKILTRQADDLILNGITRQSVINCAKILGYNISYKGFTLTDAISADEAFITSATTFVTPVVNINGKKISTGKPGEFTGKLRKEYIKNSLKTAI